MLQKSFFSIAFLAIFSFTLLAQETWTLERCIEYAQKNSITVKQSDLQITNAILTEKQLKANKRPNLTASTSLGANAGRSINPALNTFVTEFIGFNSINLSTGGPIYQGGQIDKSIAQNKYNIQAAKFDMEQAAMNIALNVASSYLRILLGEEQLIASKKRLEQSQKQVSQIQKLIEAGARPVNDKFEFLAQQARNEQAIVTAQNTVDLEYLTLKQLLEIDPDLPFKIDRPIVNPPSESGVEGLSLRAVYQQAYNRQPQILAGESRLRSTQMQADIERTSYRPSLNWFGGLSSNYSTFSIPGFPRPTYLETLRNNFGQNFGINLNIPIYDRGLTRIAIERAKINVINQELTNKRTDQQLKSDIQNALASAKAAKKQYFASEKAFEAAKKVYESVERRLEVGTANIFESTTARNNLETSEQDLIIAKYDYLFRLKIVDFYQGKKITLDK